MMELRKSSDGNGATQLSEQNYAKRTATSLREAKNMKIYSENRSEGLYEPKNAIFGLFFDFPRLQAQKRLKNEENSVQQGVPPYSAQSALSGER